MKGTSGFLQIKKINDKKTKERKSIEYKLSFFDSFRFLSTSFENRKDSILDRIHTNM